MKYNSLPFIIGAFIVAAGAYWYFFTGTGNEPPLSATSVSQSPAQTQFQALVSQLQPISFNTDIFSDPKFAALVDLATPVIPETLGRLDPFASVPGTSGK